jgi:anti-sigma regulatory factor (Ser/Thr protein kinase)
MSFTHQAVAVTEESQPFTARASARQLAEQIGFDDSDAYRVGLVATEMATNLVKHTSGGEILVRTVSDGPHAEIELLAIDRGPGIPDLHRSLSDGYSTAGSPGTGLGAIRRLADDFDIYSTVRRGTVVLARLRAKRAPMAPRRRLQVGAVSVPKPGEAVCGDGWCVQHRHDDTFIAVADGLGHGLGAADAAGAAIAAFVTGMFKDSVDALQTVHDAIRHTRGAAAAVAVLHPGQRVLKYGGVGNISATVHTNGTTRHAVSHNGTLGHAARVFREYTYPWDAKAVLVMHSDGLTAHWSFDEYPGLLARQPAVIAAVLYRDFGRSRDDATVVVARESYE